MGIDDNDHRAAAGRTHRDNDVRDALGERPAETILEMCRVRVAAAAADTATADA